MLPGGHGRGYRFAGFYANALVVVPGHPRYQAGDTVQPARPSASSRSTPAGIGMMAKAAPAGGRLSLDEREVGVVIDSVGEQGRAARVIDRWGGTDDAGNPLPAIRPVASVAPVGCSGFTHHCSTSRSEQAASMATFASSAAEVATRSISSAAQPVPSASRTRIARLTLLLYRLHYYRYYDRPVGLLMVFAAGRNGQAPRRSHPGSSVRPPPARRPIAVAIAKWTRGLARQRRLPMERASMGSGHEGRNQAADRHQ